MKFSLLLKLMKFWPPFLGAGIRVKQFNADCSEVVVQMKMRFWNKITWGLILVALYTQ
ncbi:DUF4442 domain-containing protein [Legionella maceachernii]|uniref:Uncharacterized protein n=1 Tax=Legionella maceachernii TaxID=466 RepID=A0A0W0VVU4_9GAMM|nr:DUF4442 domain-containing protein [Legionella maceachernii]KTD24420.1 hypothetical protein Lmac_2507 [Legionella maceachernii]SJZ67278.1 hypothetical protein SAMN02745128_00726 [Legionella maceachernii]SUP02033.1 Uncharacterised protein [Legionella maceachernii]